MATNTYVALATQTLTSTAASVTFSSISGAYTDLALEMQPATTHTSATFPYVRFNGDSGSNYSYTELNGNGTNATSARDTNQTIGWTSPQMGSISNTLGDNTSIVNIMNYNNSTTNKTYLSRANRAGSTLDYQGVEAVVGLWRNTAAITSVLVGNRRGGVDYNFSIGSTFTLYGIKAVGGDTTPKATGGVVTQDATYYYHTFAGSNTFTPLQSLTCDVLVVAGGGGGGGANAGGGAGAGGLVEKTGISVTATGYSIVIGGGGVGQIPISGGGTNGGDSSAFAYTGTGGGTGGYWVSTSTRNGVSGGSGGGGGEYAGAGTVGSSTQTSYSGAGFGFAGGSPYVNSADIRTGGGGGAGAIGGNGVSGGNAGSGGVGRTSSLINAMGAATGTGQLSGGNYYYAGGGGGSQYANGSLNGAGGYGGGGAGGTGLTNNAVAGTVNTGGGGGGSGYQNAYDTTRVNGGSGIVIVRYLKA